LELQPPPPVGKPYGVPIPGSKVEGRSEVYRHWRFKDGLLETLDPNVRRDFKSKITFFDEIY
jgi:long-chain acyl-CoA synthetase